MNKLSKYGLVTLNLLFVICYLHIGNCTSMNWENVCVCVWHEYVMICVEMTNWKWGEIEFGNGLYDYDYDMIGRIITLQIV